jgi:hypothetical protein
MHLYQFCCICCFVLILFRFFDFFSIKIKFKSEAYCNRLIFIFHSSTISKYSKKSKLEKNKTKYYLFIRMFEQSNCNKNFEIRWRSISFFNRKIEFEGFLDSAGFKKVIQISSRTKRAKLNKIWNLTTRGDQMVSVLKLYWMIQIISEKVFSGALGIL